MTDEVPSPRDLARGSHGRDQSPAARQCDSNKGSTQTQCDPNGEHDMKRPIAAPGEHAATERERAATDGTATQPFPVAPDLVLTVDDQRVTLHAMTPHGVRELVRRADVRDAWAAVDRIDLQELETQRAVDRAA